MERIKAAFSLENNPYRKWILRRYENIEARAATLDDQALAQEILKYDKNFRNTLLIGSLGVANYYGLLVLSGRYGEKAPLIVLMSAGPAFLAISAMSATRGIIRQEERQIFENEERKRAVIDFAKNTKFSQPVAELLGGGEVDATRYVGRERDSVKVGVAAFFVNSLDLLRERTHNPSQVQKDDVLAAANEVIHDSRIAFVKASTETLLHPEDMHIIDGVQRGREIAYHSVNFGPPINYDLFNFTHSLRSLKNPLLEKVADWLEP